MSERQETVGDWIVHLDDTGLVSVEPKREPKFLDRKVTVNEADLRFALDNIVNVVGYPINRFRAALDALGPEPCGHPSARSSLVSVGEPHFRCVLPTGHHAWAGGRPSCNCCGEPITDPIHCGDAHQPPGDVWAKENP